MGIIKTKTQKRLKDVENDPDHEPVYEYQVESIVGGSVRTARALVPATKDVLDAHAQNGWELDHPLLVDGQTVALVLRRRI